MSTNLVTVFNDHFSEFVNDIHGVFPDDPDILTAKNALLTIRKANPKLLVKIWIQYVFSPYKNQIENGDINFISLYDDIHFHRDYSGNEIFINDSIKQLNIL